MEKHMDLHVLLPSQGWTRQVHIGGISIAVQIFEPPRHKFCHTPVRQAVAHPGDQGESNTLQPGQDPSSRKKVRVQ